MPQRQVRRARLFRVALRGVVVAMLASVVGLGGGPVVAQTDPDQELADRYAPLLNLKDQDGPCDDTGEPFAPMSVDLVLDNPLVVMRQVGPQNPVLVQAPGASDLFGLGESVFLDYPGSALKPGCVYEQDFRRLSADRPAVVYAHIATQDDEPNRLALQYWFFWYYNDWNNKHEGDWEGIQLLFDVGTAEEALRTEPVGVGYAQHEGGERADWDDAKLERVGSRPVVYPSAGSHASYYGDALYLGRSGSEGFGCDITDGPSSAVDPEVVVLPDAVDDPDSPLAWLAFEGRWGERQSGPFNGPTGPTLKERWTAPFDWHEELRSRSVVVPGDDGSAAGLIESFCGVVEFGSAQLITLNESPAFLLIAVVVLSAIVAFGLGRTDWTRVRPLPIVARRRAGQLIRAAWVLFRRHTGQWLLIGLVYFPVALLAGLALQLFRLIPFIDALLESEADVGMAGIVLAVLIGGSGHFLGLTLVGAGVAFRMHEIEEGHDLTAAGVFRAIGARAKDLVTVYARAAVVIALLCLSVVGIPWGLRLAVRYQFTAPVTMLDHTRGRGTLDRSAELVAGRVLHTGGVVVLLYALVGLVAVVVGMLLLVLFAGVPLWLFSVLVTGSSALTAPYVGIAITLLYGDARAEMEGAGAADCIEVDDARDAIAV